MARLKDPHKLSPVEDRLWAALSGGHRTYAELMAEVDDTGQCTLANLRCWMNLLRTKIRARGSETIICEDGGYRRVAYVDALSTTAAGPNPKKETDKI